MPKRNSKRKRSGDRLPTGTGHRNPVGVRIVGGRFRGRKLQYGGDFGVRPMKDRVREAVFNLIGPGVKGTHVVDLFGGTGALAMEALSRGAVGATIIERHAPTAHIIRANIDTLQVGDICDLRITSAFHWIASDPPLPETPWTVFYCPPYRLFQEQREEMLDIIRVLMERAPGDSIFIVESDGEFDHDLLPEHEDWKHREYPPAVVGVWYKPLDEND